MDGGDKRRHVEFIGGSVPNESLVIDRIMLRFRPIMPKPASLDTFSCPSHQENKRVMFDTKRSKRKYVRVCKKNNTTTSSSKAVNLMPKMEGQDCMKKDAHADRTAWKEVVLTVDCVTEACMDEGVLGLGCTDEERMRNLESDTCPGFISDCSHKVKFVNNAYKRFVSLEEEDEVVTCLAVKRSLPLSCSEFSCRVKLEYSDKKCSKIVPCDVWRMDFGGFAWKLDVKAALSLGL